MLMLFRWVIGVDFIEVIDLIEEGCCGCVFLL